MRKSHDYKPGLFSYWDNSFTYQNDIRLSYILAKAVLHMLRTNNKVQNFREGRKQEDRLPRRYTLFVLK